MIRQPFTRAARKSKLEVAVRTVGRIDLPNRWARDWCPICGYRGRFLRRGASTGTRLRSQCPRCRCLERHRIQHLVYEGLREDGLLSGSLLEAAPEPFSPAFLQTFFDRVVTTDLLRSDVDVRTDLTALPFADEAFDVVVASHVLEHIPDETGAVNELARVTRRGGIAVLPVPIVNAQTVEYQAANRFEDYHVRAPGPDFYDRYLGPFDDVSLFRSSDFAVQYQTYLFEDRTVFPSERFPLRDAATGEMHEDIVAVARRRTR